MGSAPGLSPTITDRVRRILTLARENARARGSGTAWAEDLLLAILDDGGGVACAVLGRLGADPLRLTEDLRGALHDQTESPAPLSELVTAAAREATFLGHSYVGTEHLLIGIARASSTPAARLLADQGVTVETAAATAAELLGRELGR